MRCAMIRCVATVSRAQQWAWLPGYDVPELKLEFVYDYKGRWRDPKSGTLQNCSSAQWFCLVCGLLPRWRGSAGFPPKACRGERRGAWGHAAPINSVRLRRILFGRLIAQ